MVSLLFSNTAEPNPQNGPIPWGNAIASAASSDLINHSQ